MTELTNIFRIVNGFRYVGAGCKVSRSIYKFPETYWILAKVNLSTDQNHGSAYGHLVWRGRPRGKIEKIHSARKKEWTLVSMPDYSKFKGKPQHIEQLVQEAREAFLRKGTYVNEELRAKDVEALEKWKSAQAEAQKGKREASSESS